MEASAPRAWLRRQSRWSPFEVAFWLVALAPLALTPFLIPRLNRQNGWLARIARAVLVLAPLVAAVVLASKHETIAFEEPW